MSQHRSTAARRALLAAGLALAAAGAGAGPAAAQDGTSCRGSAARLLTAGAVAAEPTVANAAGDPCATADAQAVAARPLGALTVNDPRASTRRGPGVIAADARVSGVTGDLGGIAVTVGAAQASQVVSCAGGSAAASGASRVDALSINGVTVPVVADRPLDIDVGVVRVRANHVAGGTRTALILDAPGAAQLVLGEAVAAGDACATAPGGAGDGGGAGVICPPGAVFDVARGLCVIRTAGQDGQPGTTIVVGKPYEGPSGGSVVTLEAARAMATRGELPKSRRLRGPGNRYVVLGSDGNDRITGTDGRDRILALRGNDRVDGGRGDDCLDGGTGRDVLSGALGADRQYGGSGADAVNGGSGTDRLDGGAGNDSINAGYGRDTVMGGSGRDSINAATAGPASKRLHCGSGADKLRINVNERRRVRACERVYTIR